MNRIIYLVSPVVVVLIILSVLGLRRARETAC